MRGILLLIGVLRLSGSFAQTSVPFGKPTVSHTSNATSSTPTATQSTPAGPTNVTTGEIPGDLEPVNVNETSHCPVSIFDDDCVSADMQPG